MLSYLVLEKTAAGVLIGTRWRVCIKALHLKHFVVFCCTNPGIFLQKNKKKVLAFYLKKDQQDYDFKVVVFLKNFVSGV